MKVDQLTPRMIGQYLRITDHDLHVEGTLAGLDAMTETITEANPMRSALYGEDVSAYLTGIVVTLDRHELKLTGHEEAAIIGRKR